MIQSKTIFARDLVREIPKGDLKHYLDKMMRPWKVESFRVSNDAIVMELDVAPDSEKEESGFLVFTGLKTVDGKSFFLANEQTNNQAWSITPDLDQARRFDTQRLAESFIESEDLHDFVYFDASPVVGGDDD